LLLEYNASFDDDLLINKKTTKNTVLVVSQIAWERLGSREHRSVLSAAHPEN
jgi:hypothetical protein